MRYTLEIDFDEFSYAEAIRAVLPYAKKEDIPLPEMILSAAGTPGVLENFLRFIPKEEQDKIFLSLIEKNKDRLANAAKKLADKNGMELNITDIRLNKHP
ncbi:MAG: hypothetical protein IJZ72_02730 [Oscillospiraceae bacterium]|nr:hypothetical protein [Oscillospiraceae bacterium]